MTALEESKKTDRTTVIYIQNDRYEGAPCSWGWCSTPDIAVRNDFLSGLGYERMRRLKSLCEALGRPFTEVYDSPEIDYDWYGTIG